MEATRPTVAHLVTPYLFGTGSWIHSQLVHSRRFRPVVLTQALEKPDAFPFAPVHLAGCPSSDGCSVKSGPCHLWSKYILGRYPGRPYRGILDREDAKILHAHMGWEAARTHHLALFPRRPFVASFYGRDAGLLPRRAYWRMLYRRLWPAADRFVAEGSHMAETLAAIGAPREKIRVIHLGIDADAFPFKERVIPGDAGDPVIAMMAASFREKKGIPYALEALGRVADAHPRLRLRIIGDGPQRPRIEDQIRRLGISARVDLLGYQPYDVYRQEMARAHLLLAPSVTARDGDTEGGAPVCLLEAQAAGLPILATTHCDIPEVTRPGVSALLAPERDAAALADLLDGLMRTPGRWPEMGRAGRAHVEAEFNIRIQVDRMAELYEELLPCRHS